MLRAVMDEISDEEYFNIVLPCQEKIKKHIKNRFLNEYVAFHIAIYYRNNAMWEQSFSNQVYSALDELSKFKITDCDYNLIKKILEETYEIRVLNESPLEIEDIIK